jgi:hypothetical protein
LIEDLQKHESIEEYSICIQYAVFLSPRFARHNGKEAKLFESYIIKEVPPKRMKLRTAICTVLWINMDFHIRLVANPSLRGGFWRVSSYEVGCCAPPKTNENVSLTSDSQMN